MCSLHNKWRVLSYIGMFQAYLAKAGGGTLFYDTGYDTGEGEVPLSILLFMHTYLYLTDVEREFLRR